MLFVVPTFLITSILVSGFYLLSKRNEKGGLQATSVPKSKVHLNGKLIGETPMCLCDEKDRISVGKYTLKLVSLQEDFPPFEEKIEIGDKVLTVVDRTFGIAGAGAGSILNLYPIGDKKMEVQIISMPQDAEIFLDGNLIGKTPITKSDITESDHEITLRKEGYKEKTIRIRTVLGSRLVALAYLGIDPTPSLVGDTASPSAAANVSQVIITSSLGYVNVRDTNSTSGKLIQTVNTGEVYDLIDEKDGWFEIKLTSEAGEEKTGWVSATYAQKQQANPL